MDGQLPTPNTPSPEQQQRFMPEGLPVNEVPRAETAPAPGAPSAATPQPKLTAADVAAAIAATPTVGAKPTGIVSASSAMPGTAGDVDVIEPEWVDKAEEVVQAHFGDPFGEEEAIEELQEDYLQKRYGIDVADPDARDTKPKGV